MCRLITKGLLTLTGATALLTPAIVFQSLLTSPAQAAMCLKPTGEIADCGGGGGMLYEHIPIQIRDPRWDPPNSPDLVDPPDQCQQLPHPDCTNDGDDVPRQKPPKSPRPIRFPGNQAIDPSTIMNLGLP